MCNKLPPLSATICALHRVANMLTTWRALVCLTGAQAIAQALRVNSTLRSLDLAQCGLTDMGGAQLALSLANNRSDLFSSAAHYSSLALGKDQVCHFLLAYLVLIYSLAFFWHPSPEPKKCILPVHTSTTKQNIFSVCKKHFQGHRGKFAWFHSAACLCMQSACMLVLLSIRACLTLIRAAKCMLRLPLILSCMHDITTLLLTPVHC